MNQKFNFIAEEKVEPETIKLIEHTEYSVIAKQLDDHYKLRGGLSEKWQKSLKEPEFEMLVDDNSSHKFKIRSISDRIIMASIDDESLAENITILMNLAFREGEKQIIEVLRDL